MGNKKNLYIPALILSVLMVFTGCATTLNVRVKRPAKMDVKDAKTIAVLPFQTPEWTMKVGPGKRVNILDWVYDRYHDDDAWACANYITNTLTKKLFDGKHYTLAEAYTVQNQVMTGKTPSADIYVSGKIDYLNVYDDVSVNKRTENGKVVYYKTYSRHVSAGVTYMVIDSKTNMLIDMRTRDLSGFSGERKDPQSLPSAFSLIKGDLNDVVNAMTRELQPYYVDKSIKLLSDKSKDPDMKIADEMVKNDLWEEGYNKYKKIYENTGLFEAGYNASMILEALGRYQEAKAIMTELVDTTGNKKAIRALSDINSEIYSEKRLKEQTAE